MMAATPATSPAANEVPKFSSSSTASTGRKLSSSRLLQTATETVFGPKKKPEMSAATPTTMGAVRRERAVAGPLDEKFRTSSSRFEVQAVWTSWKCPPTDTRSLAVAGGETCRGAGMWSGGQGTGQLSAAVPSNRSGYWLRCEPLKEEKNFCPLTVPWFPTGTNTMQSRLFTRNVSMSLEACG